MRRGELTTADLRSLWLIIQFFVLYPSIVLRANYCYFAFFCFVFVLLLFVINFKLYVDTAGLRNDDYRRISLSCIHTVKILDDVTADSLKIPSPVSLNDCPDIPAAPPHRHGARMYRSIPRGTKRALRPRVNEKTERAQFTRVRFIAHSSRSHGRPLVDVSYTRQPSPFLLGQEPRKHGRREGSRTCNVTPSTPSRN